MEADVHSSRHLAQLRNAQAEFLNHGGFPETLLIDHKHRTRLLQEYFNVLLYRFSEDTGKALENAVYLELRRTGTTELFFYRNEALECDFLRVERGRVMEAIQVCHDLSSAETRRRELKELMAACTRFGLNKGTIITGDDFDQWSVEQMEVDVVPFYRRFSRPHTDSAP